MGIEYLNYIISVVFFSGIVLWVWLGVRRFIKKRKADSLICFFLFVCWNFYRYDDYMKRVPPAYIHTLPDFLAWTDTSSKCANPPLQGYGAVSEFLQKVCDFVYENRHHDRITRITFNEKNYFELIGPDSLLLEFKYYFLLGSGPPGYIFNHKGYLIDLRPDRDEAPRYWGKWVSSGVREEISIEEALKLIKQWEREEEVYRIMNRKLYAKN